MLTCLSASRPRGSNYTPRDIMQQIAREQPYVRPVYGAYGALFLSVRGELFSYDSWEILQHPEDAALEVINIHMKGVDKL